MNRLLQHLLWKNRQLRHQFRMFWLRYGLVTRGFSTGMGQSAWLLHGLVRSLKPDVCVEIGSAQGWSTCHIGLALRENFSGHLHAIDPHLPTAWNDEQAIESLPILQANLRRFGLESHVTVVRKTSSDAARDWTQPIDFLLIDGDHSYDGVKADWALFAPFLRPFGVAVFHDTTWGLHGVNRPDMGVPRFVEELRRAGHPVITIDRDCGLSMVQKIPGGTPLFASPG
ncbi:MAG: class I SAM-dependent methyltransferase [Verrucomicrobia bacterium]|nr:class I SAM-dependent methyltransferase [Verrucomicrobiota bacterium]